jgi:hypothetical protein
MAVLVMNIANMNVGVDGWATTSASAAAATAAASSGSDVTDKPVNSSVLVRPEWLGLSPQATIAVTDVWSGEVLPKLAITPGQALVTDPFGPHDSRFYVLTPTPPAPLTAPTSVSTTTDVVGMSALSEFRWAGFPHLLAEAVSTCQAGCASLGHCCFGAKNEPTDKTGPTDKIGPTDNELAVPLLEAALDSAVVQCDGASGRDCGHGRDSNQASCQMGCIIAAHSPTRESCKDTCMATRQRESTDPDADWKCEYYFVPTNQTFNMCGQCPMGCPANEFCGVRVMDYECEQGCDFTFGCDAAASA